jgi:hypothetical protein
MGDDMTTPIDGIDHDLGLLIGGAKRKIDNIITDYFTERSLSVYDSSHNEILFIEPSRDFSIVLNLSDFSYTMRKDVLLPTEYYNEQRTAKFSKSLLINNNDVLIAEFSGVHSFDTYFFSLDEHTAAKSIADNNFENNVLLIATTTLFSPNYMKVEHLIARFFQNANLNNKSNIYLYLTGSRDGVRWRTVARGKITNIEKPMQGIEIRRCFTSCRYFQFVFAKKNTGKNVDSDRLMNNFSGFCFDFLPCDNPKKLR